MNKNSNILIEHTHDDLPSHLIQNGSDECKNLICLTYDSGFEDTETLAILEVLKKHDVKATFFLTGVWVENFPDLAKSIVSEGNLIGNHSYSHPDMTKLSHDEIVKDIMACEETIKEVIGVNPRPFFREPYGALNLGVLKAVGTAGYNYSILWSIDTIDWKLPPTQCIVDRILKKIRGGDIILMHTFGNNTAEATDIVIPYIKALGLKFVTIDKLFE